MIVSTKIRLKPTKEQEVLFWKSCGVARWSYNYFLAESENHYAEYLKGNKEKKTVKEGDVRKYINVHTDILTPIILFIRCVQD